MNASLNRLVDKALQEKTERFRQYEEWLQEYLRTKDLKVIKQVISSFPFALEENRWIVEVIAKWRREGEYDLLKKLFTLPRGNKKGASETFRLYGLTVVMVDSLVSKGLSKTKAFDKLASLRAFSSMDAVKKAYYATRKSKKMYQLYVEKTADSYILTLHNTRVNCMINGVNQELFGSVKFTIPENPREQVTFSVDGTVVADEAFQKLRATVNAE